MIPFDITRMYLLCKHIMPNFVLILVSVWFYDCKRNQDISALKLIEGDPKVDFLSNVWQYYQAQPPTDYDKMFDDLYDMYTDNISKPGEAIPTPDDDWRVSDNRLPSGPQRSDNLYRAYDETPGLEGNKAEATLNIGNSEVLSNVTSPENNTKTLYRAYLNPKRQDAEAIFEHVITQWVAKKSHGILGAKIVGRSSVGTRADSIVIYFTDITAISDLLYDVDRQYPGRFIDEVPAESSRIRGGMSIAPQIDDKSFGHVLINAIIDQYDTEDPPTKFEDFANRVQKSFNEEVSKSSGAGCRYILPSLRGY